MDKEIIKKRLIEQEIYVKKYLSKPLIKREAFNKYKKHLEVKLIKAIIGPRRAGKTTLGLQLLQDKEFYYVNFDDEVLATIKQEELGTLLETLNEQFGNRKYIFLDEIQNITSWELFANRLQRLEYNIILSGSNSKLLSRELSSHLGGRVFTIEVLPFSFKEFLNTKNISEVHETDEGIGLIKNKLHEYISNGGLPDILLNINPELRAEYFTELFNTIIFRDISQRYKIMHTSELASLANILLNQFATRASLTKISKELGVTVHTLTKYASYLDASYLVLPSRKFSYKPREMETSFKKYYGIDTGLINSKKTTLTVDFGKLIENIVALELKRRGLMLYYYLVDNRYEVDFVISKNNKIIEVIQVVNDEKGLPEREIETGLLACKKLKSNTLRVITWSKENKIKKGKVNIIFIPLWKWLLE